ncbi:RusA family crossover junction endodeoxyribonuclease [Ramlibacter sp. PS3R-8]|uniref:RusA family crossover junction endodeoxyribonuclease n=1 Tax=Ramlibacter sp. PS3R-8 TaxID=3133437 RepID=UPI0030AC6851
MLFPHSVFIKGEAFGKPYMGKRPDAPRAWIESICSSTKSWPIVVDACLLRVTFLLPPSKFSNSKFLGPDLDNLMKLFLDALKNTVFRDPSDDSFVVPMEVAKTRVESDDNAGAMLEIVPLQTHS